MFIIIKNSSNFTNDNQGMSISIPDPYFIMTENMLLTDKHNNAITEC